MTIKNTYKQMDKDKKIVADWIIECNERLAEIEFLLDKAYPDGAQDRFYHDWEGLLERRSVER